MTNSMIKGRQADSARRRQRVIKAITAASTAGGEISVSAIARAAGVDRTFPYRHPDLLQLIHAAQTEPPAATGGGPWSAAPPCRPTWPTHTHASRAKPRTPGSLSASSQRSSASKPGTNRGSEPRPTSISSSGASQPSSRRSWSCQGNSRNASRSSTARGTNRELMTKLNRHI